MSSISDTFNRSEALKNCGKKESFFDNKLVLHDDKNVMITDYVIYSMTIMCFTNVDIFLLGNIFKYGIRDDIFIYYEYEGKIDADSPEYQKMVKRTNKKINRSNSFRNQCTIIVKLGDSYSYIKCLRTGTFQVTGAKCMKRARAAIECVANMIKLCVFNKRTKELTYFCANKEGDRVDLILLEKLDAALINVGFNFNICLNRDAIKAHIEKNNRINQDAINAHLEDNKHLTEDEIEAYKKDNEHLLTAEFDPSRYQGLQITYHLRPEDIEILKNALVKGASKPENIKNPKITVFRTGAINISFRNIEIIEKLYNMIINYILDNITEFEEMEALSEIFTFSKRTKIIGGKRVYILNKKVLKRDDLLSHLSLFEGVMKNLHKRFS